MLFLITHFMWAVFNTTKLTAVKTKILKSSYQFIVVNNKKNDSLESKIFLVTEIESRLTKHYLCVVIFSSNILFYSIYHNYLILFLIKKLLEKINITIAFDY